MSKKKLEVRLATLTSPAPLTPCVMTLQEQAYHAHPERACPQGCRYDFDPAIRVLALYQCRVGHAFCACCLLQERDTPASGSKCPVCAGRSLLTMCQR